MDLLRVTVVPRHGVRDLEATLRGAVRAPLRARLSGRARRGRSRTRRARPEPEAPALQEAEVRASQRARVSARNGSPLRENVVLPHYLLVPPGWSYHNLLFLYAICFIHLQRIDTSTLYFQ